MGQAGTHNGTIKQRVDSLRCAHVSPGGGFAGMLNAEFVDWWIRCGCGKLLCAKCVGLSLTMHSASAVRCLLTGTRLREARALSSRS